MMDSHDTNLPLNQGDPEEIKDVTEVSDKTAEDATTDTTLEKQSEPVEKPTKESVLKRLNDLAKDPENASKLELDISNNHSINYII